MAWGGEQQVAWVLSAGGGGHARASAATRQQAARARAAHANVSGANGHATKHSSVHNVAATQRPSQPASTRQHSRWPRTRTNTCVPHLVAVKRADHAGVAADVLNVALPQVAPHVEAVCIGGVHRAALARQQDLAAVRLLQKGWGAAGRMGRVQAAGAGEAEGKSGDQGLGAGCVAAKIDQYAFVGRRYVARKGGWRLTALPAADSRLQPAGNRWQVAMAGSTRRGSDGGPEDRILAAPSTTNSQVKAANSWVQSRADSWCPAPALSPPGPHGSSVAP